ncbi:LemA family protein [Providencia rettgeri]|nr:LemA family protein [Providencia rettgeri]
MNRALVTLLPLQKITLLSFLVSNLQLQIALSDVENKLAQRREGFNDATTEYNTAIQMFPDSLIANAFRFSALPLLDISEDEKNIRASSLNNVSLKVLMREYVFLLEQLLVL